MDRVSLLLELLKYKSITPDDDGSFSFIKEYLFDYECIEQEVSGVKNIFLYKRFNNSNRHLCFGGHIDVVPEGDGWRSDPFVPEISDGFIYARGTQDMKSGVAAFLYTLKHTKNFDGVLSALITSDEEGEGVHGTREMLKLLAKDEFLPQSVVVAEPTCEESFGDTIKIGRRGSINGVLKIIGKQGHVAYPSKNRNPVEIMAPFLERLATHKFDYGCSDFEPTRLVITDIRGGLEATNVTPSEVKIMFNVRNSPNISQDSIESFISSLLTGVEYRLRLQVGSKPFVTKRDSKIVKLMQNIVSQSCEIEPSLGSGGGTSDARYFGGEFGIDCVEFGVSNDRIHAVDERVSICEYEKLCEIFRTLVDSY